MRSGTPAPDIDAYIASAPAALQEKLTKLRTTIAKAAPAATEAIAYGMPTFRLHGNLVHFAVFTKHIGFYPGPDAITTFAEELADVATTSKGAIQFPLDRPLPLALITKITKQRVQVNTAKAAAKTKAKAKAKPASARGAGR